MSENTYRLFKAIWLCILGLTIGILQQRIDSSLSRIVNIVTAGAAAEQVHLDAELRETQKATNDIKHLVGYTDLALNGNNGRGGILAEVRKALETINATTLVRVDSVVGDSDAALRRFSDSSDLVLGDAGASLQKMGPLVVALTDRVNDPQFDLILANANQSMQNLRDMTASGAHAIKTTDDVITKEAQIILAPVSKIKAATLFVLTAIGKFLGI